MNIYLIRHARQNSPLCNVNVELSKEGRIQAELLGKRLINYHIDVIYSSELIRAIETAHIINQDLNRIHHKRADLNEISFGEMEGKSDQEIAEQYSEFKLEQDRLIEDLPYPGGENGQQVYHRAMKVLDEIISSQYENVAVVTHGGVIRALLAGCLKMNMANKFLIAKDLENTSITKLFYNKDKKRYYIESINDYAHLEQHETLLRKHFIR